MRTGEIEKLCEGRKVLDVGCGRAKFVRALGAQVREALLLHVPGQQPLVPPAREEVTPGRPGR